MMSTASEKLTPPPTFTVRQPMRRPNSTSLSWSPTIHDLPGSMPCLRTASRPIPTSGFLHEQRSSGVWGQ